jgi:hypothetical protein
MYKYLCLRDFVMDCDYEGQSPQVAFKEGNVYTFKDVDGISGCLVCEKNNLGHNHYMDKDLDFFYHFLLLEEE